MQQPIELDFGARLSLRPTAKLTFSGDSLFPALAYIVDMNYRTGGAYGVNECILASAIAALAFSIFSVQPLTIVGVTGLINLFNYTAYDILKGTGVNYLQFQAWSLMCVQSRRAVRAGADRASFVAGPQSRIGSSPSSTFRTTLASSPT